MTFDGNGKGVGLGVGEGMTTIAGRDGDLRRTCFHLYVAFSCNLTCTVLDLLF